MCRLQASPLSELLHFISVCYVRCCSSDHLDLLVCFATIVSSSSCQFRSLEAAVYLYIQVQLPSLVTGGVWCPESCNLRPSAWWLLTTPLPRPWPGPDKNYKYYIQIIIPVWVLIWNYHHNCLWSKSSLEDRRSPQPPGGGGKHQRNHSPAHFSEWQNIEVNDLFSISSNIWLPAPLSGPGDSHHG